MSRNSRRSAAERRDSPARSAICSLLDSIVLTIDPRVLGSAAMIGRDVDEQLFVAVSDRPEDEVQAALRPPIANHVLAPRPTASDIDSATRSCARPSSTICSPASGSPSIDRSPRSSRNGQSSRRHRRPPLPPSSRITGPRRVTRRAPFLPSSRPGAAEAARAWTEASDAFEHAAMLAAAGAGSLKPIDVAGLMMEAAVLADFAGDLVRGLELGRAAMDLDDGADPGRSGVLFNSSARSRTTQAISSSPTPPTRGPSSDPGRTAVVERADAVVTLGARRMILTGTATPSNRGRGIAFFRTVDQPGSSGRPWGQALASASLGRADEARVAVDESLVSTRDSAMTPLLKRARDHHNSMFALHVLGDFDRVPSVVTAPWRTRPRSETSVGGESGWKGRPR